MELFIDRHLPKAELNTRNSKRRRLVEFLVFNSIYLIKSVPSKGKNRVQGFIVKTPRGVGFLFTLLM